MKRYLFIAIILLAVLVTACTPPTSNPPEALTPTTTALPSKTPLPTATPLPSNTPLPTTAALPSNTPLPSASPTPPKSVIACVPVAFLPGGSRILAQNVAEVQIYDLESMSEKDLIKAPARLTAVALSPDGKTLAWALDDFSIQLVRLADHQLLHTMKGHTDQVTKLKFTPDGSRLISASHDTWVRVWDMDGKQVDAFQPTGALDWTSAVMGIGISPDGKQLATVPVDGPVKLWDLASHKKVAELGGTGGYDISDVAFSPDGKFVAADLVTGLFLWKIADGRALLGESTQINSMAFAFSPDGRFLAYGDLNTVILSSPDGSQMIRTLEGFQSLPWNLVFSPDGSKLAARDGVEVRIWQVPDGKLLYVGQSSCQ